MAEFLVVRGDDMLLLAVRLIGFTLAPGATGPAVATPVGHTGTLLVTFPPQHVGEAVKPFPDPTYEDHAGDESDPYPPLLWGARLAGLSRVAFTVTGSVALTPDGILAALATATVRPCEAEPGLDDTAIELPWRLQVSPADAVTCRHPDRPVRSAGGATALWRTRFAGTNPDGFGLRVLAALPAEEPDFPMPLTTGQRRTIAAYGLREPARAHRLELSTLGGTVAVRGAWHGLSWKHEAVLGRDMTVEVAQKGMLYPFGHRALLVSTTQRDPTAGYRVGALRKVVTLVVTEPAVGPGPDPQLRHTFPFDEVEIVQTCFTGLDDGPWAVHSPPTVGRDRLQALVDEAQGRLREAASHLQSAMIDAGWDYMGGPGFDEAVSQFTHLYEYDQYQEMLSRLEYHTELLESSQRPVPVATVPAKGGKDVQFPVRCRGRSGELKLELPMVFVADLSIGEPPYSPPFVSLTDPAVHRVARELFAAHGNGEVKVAGVPVNLAGTAQPKPGDVHEVHGITVAAEHRGGGFQPTLTGVKVALPALRTLLGENREPVDVVFSEGFRRTGTADVLLTLKQAGKIDVDFSGKVARAGGLITPKLAATGFSRAYGLVPVGDLVADAAGRFEPERLFHSDAKVLGFALRDLVGKVSAPPQITAGPGRNGAPEVTMVWPKEAVPLRKHPPFVPEPGANLDLRVVAGPDEAVTTCTISGFSLVLPPGAEPPAAGQTDTRLLTMRFGSVAFRQQAGQPPVVEVDGVDATFHGLLLLLRKLQEAIDLGNLPPGVEVTRTGVTARYGVQIPEVSTGVFVLRNIAFSAAVEVPFDGRPVSVGLAFASRQAPFNLSVLLFGGGGYIDLLIDRTGLARLEASLEFGAAVAIDFFVARGEVHALGGVRYQKLGDRVSLTGFVRIGGSVEVLGLVSVSIELMIGLTYDFDNNWMYGRATLVVEVDLTFFSESVELDSGVWTLMGDEPEPEARRVRAARSLTERQPEWQQYQEAFA